MDFMLFHPFIEGTAKFACIQKTNIMSGAPNCMGLQYNNDEKTEDAASIVEYYLKKWHASTLGCILNIISNGFQQIQTDI